LLPLSSMNDERHVTHERIILGFFTPLLHPARDEPLRLLGYGFLPYLTVFVSAITYLRIMSMRVGFLVFAVSLAACGQEAQPTAPLVYFDVRRDVPHGAIRPVCTPNNRIVRSYIASDGEVIPLEPVAGWCDYQDSLAEEEALAASR
jgi:hypothetical protein